jgi:AcrR family transcriptional regulator
LKINNSAIQKNIITLTETLLIKYGIRGWNMDTVTHRAGMAKNTLYKIIGTKEQLIEKIVISKLRANIDAIVGIFKREPEFLKAVEIGSRHLVHAISEDNPLILTQVFREYPAIKEKFDTIALKLGTSIHYYLNRAKKSGIIRKDVDNDILISSVTAIINHYLSLPYKGKEFEERIYKAFTYLLRGILK